jgi:uncharacterized damage-inducible protein DinB
MKTFDPLKTHLLEQANANRWINQEWWKALSGLSLEELDQPQGAFFGSIFGTWNHILLGDRIWLGRISGQDFLFQKLSDRVCASKERFSAEREKTDLELIECIAGTPDVLRVLSYRGNQSQPYATPLSRIYQHLFAHQAHHRGQIHQMCDERQIALPDGGLIAFYRH